MYPVRFLHQNPEGKLLFETVSQFAKQLSTCPWSGVQLGRLYSTIHGAYSGALNRKLPTRINRADYLTLLNYSYGIEPNFNAFVPFIAKGQRIVSIGPALSSGFENTDLKGLHLSDFNLPFESVYLYLENCPWKAVSSNGHFDVEGVMVYRLGGLDGKLSLRIALCPKDWDYKSLPLFIPSLVVKGSDYEEDCSNIARLALQTDLQDIESTLLVNDPKAKETLNFAYKIQTENAEVYTKAINLVLNAFAFMSGYPDEMGDSFFSSSAPQRLVHLAKTGTPKEQQRSMSKLNNLGFAPFFRIGKDLESELSASLGAAGREGVRPHLRRGHWMHQAHGPSRTLRKLMWRKPCLVGSQEVELPSASEPQRLRFD